MGSQCTLPLTKAEQETPVAESMPQELVKVQAAPGPPAPTYQVLKDAAPGEESYEDQHSSVTMHADIFPLPFMCSKQTPLETIHVSLSLLSLLSKRREM